MMTVRRFAWVLLPLLVLVGCQSNDVEGEATSDVVALPASVEQLYVEIDAIGVSLLDEANVAHLLFNRILDAYPADLGSPRLIFRTVNQGIPPGAAGLRLNLMRWEMDRSNTIDCQFSASLVLPGEQPVRLGLFSGNRFLLSANTNRDVRKAYLSAAEQAAKKLWKKLRVEPQ